jgi:hypothetical protein
MVGLNFRTSKYNSFDENLDLSISSWKTQKSIKKIGNRAQIDLTLRGL